MGTQDFALGTVFDFDDQGKLQGVRLSDNHTIAGIDFRKDTELIFDQRGEVRLAQLNVAHIIQGRHCPAGTMVSRNRHGTWQPLPHAFN